ncbi:DNA-3-methyladenine glycosylase [Yanghanlia caeni]|uniref:Putative 3-methyladenine DNA glycosylase n=1 Tax=Yanghanlia caeni TaxID=3064283 RepID=A0ABU1D5U9_9BURK|nr:DNA-3-methyladenine glycosylase [Alcaligenaceae bacterium LG-2]
MMLRLPRTFYQRPATEVAPDLLGKLLVHQTDLGLRIGRIVEVEAYLGREDLAAHSSKGVTPRTQVMFGEAGHAYVYLIYGMHHCMNVVTGPAGSGSAVLLRALEPVQGLDCDTRGPGRLARAMGVDKRHYGTDLCTSGSTLHLADDGHVIQHVSTSARIGVHYAGEWADKPLRFYAAGSKWVSKAPSSRAKSGTAKKPLAHTKKFVL